MAGSKLDMIPVFRDMISSYYIRRLNTENNGLSNIKMNIIQIPILLTKEQKELCKSLKFNHMMDKDSSILKLYSDFTKVACCPQIFDNSYTNISPKVIELIKQLKSSDKKFVLFASYLEHHKIIRSYLDKANIQYVSVTGEQSAKEKDQSKQQFYSNPEIKVILLTGAGKFGLNLQITNKLVFMTLPYTPSDVFQIIGRIFRIGQEEDVDILIIYHKDSLEEDMFNILERKQREIDTFFEQDKAYIFELKDKKELDVSQSFIKRNYGIGPYFDDICTEEDRLLIPEKELLILDSNKKSILSTNYEYFNKILSVDL